MEDWERPLKTQAALGAQHMLEQEAGTSNPQPRNAVRVRELFSLVVAYRNKSGEGHGAVASTGQLHERARRLQEALLDVLKSMRSFRDVDLLHIDEIAMLKGGRVKVTARLLRGNQPVVESWEAPRDKVNFDPDTVCLAKGHEILLPLSPWLVWGEGKHREPELFMFNFRNAGRFHYLTYPTRTSSGGIGGEAMARSWAPPGPVVAFDPSRPRPSSWPCWLTFLPTG